LQQGRPAPTGTITVFLTTRALTAEDLGPEVRSI
jgi:hypothetical protein